MSIHDFMENMYQIIADFQTMHFGCSHYGKICTYTKVQSVLQTTRRQDPYLFLRHIRTSPEHTPNKKIENVRIRAYIHPHNQQRQNGCTQYS